MGQCQSRRETAMAPFCVFFVLATENLISSPRSSSTIAVIVAMVVVFCSENRGCAANHVKSSSRSSGTIVVIIAAMIVV